MKHKKFINHIQDANWFLGYDININNIKDFIILSARARTFLYTLKDKDFQITNYIIPNTVEYLNYNCSLVELQTILETIKREQGQFYNNLQELILNEHLKEIKQVRQERYYEVLREAINMVESTIRNYKDYLYNRTYVTPIQNITVYKSNCKTRWNNTCKKDKRLKAGEKYLLIKEFESENIFKFGDKMYKIMDKNNYTYLVEQKYFKVINCSK